MEAWYDKSVFYHIYPLGLCGASKQNTNHSQGEGMKALIKWIPHIKNIGCNGIYIGPLFESISHGYDTTDYKKVDGRLGSNQDFKDFVEECHKLQIKVIVDGVFNHTGREFFAFQDIKNNRENSKYIHWYSNVNFNDNNEHNDGFSYDSWSGYSILAKLNLKNPEVKNYLFDVIRFWDEEFDIDGIRLDAADVLDFDFMHEMRMVANEVKDDFWLMGEVIHGDYSRWTGSEMLHSVTNYELHKGLFSGHNDHNYFEIAHTVKRIQDLCGDTKLYSFVDNHDVNRIWNKLNNKEHLYPVHMLLYTLPGIPSIYYGSEFAIEGQKDDGQDERIRPSIRLEDYCVLNQGGEIDSYKTGEYSKLLQLISALGALKSQYKELTYGAYKELVLTNRQYSFARILKDKAVIIAVNNDDNPVEMHIPVPIQGKSAVDMLTGEEVVMINNTLSVTIEKNYGQIIYVK